MSIFLIKQEKVPSDHCKGYDVTLNKFGYGIYIKGKGALLSNNESFLAILFGTALYKGERVSVKNLSEIAEHETPHLNLSGRFLLVIITPDCLKVTNSIFGSFPCFIDSENTAISSNANLLRQAHGEGLDINGVRERILFFCNYAYNKHTGVSSIPPGSIISLANGQTTSDSYIDKVIVDRKIANASLAMKELACLISSNINAYFPNKGEEKKIVVSFTGGRDSRTLLYALIKEGIQNVTAFTVGSENDVEYFVGHEFTKIFDITHERFEPENLDCKKISDYAKYFDSINFPSLYKPQLLNIEALQGSEVINTNIPETLLCHMDYFRGEEHPAINFVRKRVSPFYSKDIEWKSAIIKEVEVTALNIWKGLRSKLPSDTATNLFFGITTIQSGWAFNILRPYDISGSVVCLMEDSRIVSLLASLPKSEFYDDKFYSDFVRQEYEDVNRTPTTRSLELRNIHKTPLPTAIKYAPTIIRGLISPGSLSSLLKKNVPYISDYIIKNRDILDLYLGVNATNALVSHIHNGEYSSNRIQKAISKYLKNKNVIGDYELITPLCVIALHKHRTSDELAK